MYRLKLAVKSQPLLGTAEVAVGVGEGVGDGVQDSETVDELDTLAPRESVAVGVDAAEGD